ncbi:hypothetical protein RP20_CCG020249 [Aedes albopictus]|nr:hypothetical protein RP20_CCG020249 [Aedes albopictus]
MHYEKHKLETDGSWTLDKMLNYHGDEPKANWESKQMNSMERTRHFMFRGLQRHPECRGLYVIFFCSCRRWRRFWNRRKRMSES